MSLAHGTSVVRDGLILYCDAANKKSYPGTGATWFDLSGNGNNAERKGTATYSTWNSLGYFEHRPTGHFGAIDSGSTAPDTGGSWWEVAHNSILSPTGSWTVSGWLRVIGDQTGNGTGWFHKVGSADERGISLEPISGNFRANGSSGWSSIEYNINNNSVWANYTFVYTLVSGTYGTSTGNLKFYVNGVLVAENTGFIPAADSTQPIYLGRRNGHLRHFLNADIATYSYYNIPLSAIEIGQNFEALRGRFLL